MPSELRATAASDRRSRVSRSSRHDNFSARYDLDRQKGVFSRPAHKLPARAM